MLAYATPSDLPARIRDSVALVETLRAPHAPAGPAVAELRRVAEESLASMRAILAVPLSDRIDTGGGGLDEMPESERAEYFADLNDALDIVRASLALYEGDDFRNFMRLVRVDVPDLVPDLVRTCREYVAYTREAERSLILLGAGTDDDVDLIGDLVPDVA